MLKKLETSNEPKNMTDDASNRILEVYFAMYMYIVAYDCFTNMRVSERTAVKASDEWEHWELSSFLNCNHRG